MFSRSVPLLLFLKMMCRVSWVEDMGWWYTGVAMDSPLSWRRRIHASLFFASSFRIDSINGARKVRAIFVSCLIPTWSRTGRPPSQRGRLQLVSGAKGIFKATWQKNEKTLILHLFLPLRFKMSCVCAVRHGWVATCEFNLNRAVCCDCAPPPPYHVITSPPLITTWRVCEAQIKLTACTSEFLWSKCALVMLGWWAACR